MQNLSITVHWILRSPDQYRYLAFFSHTLLSNNNLGHHFCCMFKVCVFHIPWEFTHRTASVIVYNGWRSVHVWGSYCKQGTNLAFSIWSQIWWAHELDGRDFMVLSSGSYDCYAEPYIGQDYAWWRHKLNNLLYTLEPLCNGSGGCPCNCWRLCLKTLTCKFRDERHEMRTIKCINWVVDFSSINFIPKNKWANSSAAPVSLETGLQFSKSSPFKFMWHW